MSAAEDTRAPSRPQTDAPRQEILWGGVIAGVFFILFLGWAAFAPLDAGAYAPGQIVVSGSRQAVQHREGGLVSALHVAEGDTVRAGEVLLEISAGDLRAVERGLSGQVISLLALRARLVAERDGRTLTPPPEFAELVPEDEPLAADAMRLQQQQFAARRSSRATQAGVLNQRAAQLSRQIDGLNRQIESNREQSRLIAEELAGMRRLADQGYAPMTRVRALERAAADLEGEEGALTAQVARANEAIGETRLQILSIDRDAMAEIAEQLRQAEVTLNELQPRLGAAREQLARALVRAPASGQVVGLTVFTVGGVVQPGQTLMEIVPAEASLIIEAEVAPADADDLRVGQRTEVRFTAFRERRLPILRGELTGISADSFQDERTGRAFFRITVAVPPEELARIEAARGGDAGLRPGLPVEVVVPQRKRTALQYFLEPLTQNLWRSFREA